MTKIWNSSKNMNEYVQQIHNSVMKTKWSKSKPLLLSLDILNPSMDR